MTRKTRLQKSRKKASRLGEQAWEALEHDSLQLAVKLIRRAVEERPNHPLLWNDYGLIQERVQNYTEAEKGFRNALLLAPTLAEAYVNHATLCARLGRLHQAERLQRRAVELSPDTEHYRTLLGSYEALLPSPDETTPVTRDDVATERFRMQRFDWKQLEKSLEVTGGALLPALLTPPECRELQALFAQDALFEHTVILEQETKGQGVYRFFNRPLPKLVEQLRVEVYQALAPIANRWHERLNAAERFPERLSEFLDRCHQAGQQRTTPVLFRYRAGGFNELHRDVWGRIFFPFQLSVTLSERSGRDGDGDFSGGELLLVDDGGRKARQTELASNLGDGVLFCTYGRLITFGTGYALQPMRHGVKQITHGERFALGLPFHEYR